MVSRRRPPCHLKPAMSRMRVSRRRTSPAPVTWPEDYFRFLALRFVFFAAFGAAFAFLRFAIVPSKLEMALSKMCRRESTCTAFRLHQNARNSDST
jgi:hypothetical protein